MAVLTMDPPAAGEGKEEREAVLVADTVEVTLAVEVVVIDREVVEVEVAVED